MKAYKGFNKDMTCRGFQFEEGKTYEEPEAELCKSGFHACENPLDCLSYYRPNSSVYHEVVLDGVSREQNGDSKVCAKRITIGARLNLEGIVRGAVSFVLEKVKATTGYRAHAATTGGCSHAATTGCRAHAATTGDCSHAATTGCRAHAATTGDWAHAATTGDWAHAATTGGCSHAATTGCRAHAATTGCRAHAATTGYWAHAATTGDWAHAATTGDWAHAETAGKSSIAAALGAYSNVKAGMGCWIVCSEFSDEGLLLCVKAAKVDGDAIKPNTWYKLQNGEFVEAGE